MGFGLRYNEDEIIKIRAKSLYIINENKEKKEARRKKKEKKQKPPKKLDKKLNKSDIFLLNLKKHLQTQERKRKYAMFKSARKYVKDIKKESYRYKDMQNPNYKKFNKYRYSAFRDHILTRSHDGLTVGLAWSLLKKCWIGFKECYRLGNYEGMKFYGEGIQKYLYLLEEIPIDFSNIGLKPFKYFYS